MQKKQLKCGKLRRFAARGAGRPCAGARPVRQPQKTQKIAARIGRQFSETENVDSALGELGRAAGGLETVLLDLQNLQSIALQWIADFENQFPFKMSPVNFCHIV